MLLCGVVNLFCLMYTPRTIMKISLILSSSLTIFLLFSQTADARTDAKVISSTFLGSGQGKGIAIDKEGYIYVAGRTADKHFPCVNAVQAFLSGSEDAFIMKLNPEGDKIIYSTYIGGSSNDEARNIAVDDQGQVYITGITNSNDFPLIKPFQSQKDPLQTTFVLKLSADGSQILYSTYLGGSGFDTAFSIAVDSKQNIYVTGWTESADFPVKNAIQCVYGGGSNDMYVAKINFDGQLDYSTYLGGANWEEGYDIAVNKQGYAYIVGFTASPSFPILKSSQVILRGEKDGVLIKIDPQGKLIYSMLFGGSDEENLEGVDLDERGNIYTTGWTHSVDFPLLKPFQRHYAGQRDAFVAKFNPKGKLIFSSYFGGSDQEVGIRISVDQKLKIMTITGEVWSDDFPTRRAFQPTYGGSYDAFIMQLSLKGQPLCSSYLGGDSFETGRAVATMPDGHVLVSGSSSSNNFPIINPFAKGSEGIFLTKVFTRFRNCSKVHTKH